MRLTQWQSWQEIFNHIASPHLYRVRVGRPRVSPSSPSGGSLSRRTFMQGATGAAGLAFALGRGIPAQAAKPSTAEPYPIPHIQPGPPPSHFFFPGPVDSTDPEHGHDPSVITDFTGVIGGAEVSLSGTGIDTMTRQSDQYSFTLDLRFMQGAFLGADGRQHHGTFLFVWLDSSPDASPLGRHAYDPGSSPTGVFWITRIPEDSVHVDVENGTAMLHLKDIPVFDFFTPANSLDPAHRLDSAAALLNTVRVEWSGVTRRLEFSDAENTFAGLFLENSAAADVKVTTRSVPTRNIPGFSFASDTTQSLFAQIGQERNGVFFQQGS